MSTTSRRIGLALLVAMLGCGSDGGTIVDAPRPIDAPPPIDAPVVCTVSTPTFGDLGALTAVASFQGGTVPGVGLASFYAYLEGTVPGDSIAVDLWSFHAPFGTPAAPGPLVAGTYEITADVNTCGVCVLIATNWECCGANYDGLFAATSGTVVISAIDPQAGGFMTGTLSNLTFEHVMRAGGGDYVLANDGCATTVTSASFDGAFGGAVAPGPMRNRFTDAIGP